MECGWNDAEVQIRAECFLVRAQCFAAGADPSVWSECGDGAVPQPPPGGPPHLRQRVLAAGRGRGRGRGGGAPAATGGHLVRLLRVRLGRCQQRGHHQHPQPGHGQSQQWSLNHDSSH